MNKTVFFIYLNVILSRGVDCICYSYVSLVVMYSICYSYVSLVVLYSICYSYVSLVVRYSIC